MRKGYAALSVAVLAVCLAATVAIFWGSQPAGSAASPAGSPESPSQPDTPETPAASGDSVLWSGPSASFSYRPDVCQVTSLDDGADGGAVRLAVTDPAGASTPRIDIQTVSAAGLETPTEQEFVQFAQAVLERYFTGGLADGAVSAGTPSLDEGRWVVSLSAADAGGAAVNAQVALIGSGETRLLAVYLLPPEGASADWQAVFDSITPAA